ncbi:hypothetical protein D3C85_1477160 [compost metagenome]
MQHILLGSQHVQPSLLHPYRNLQEQPEEFRHAQLVPLQKMTEHFPAGKRIIKGYLQIDLFKLQPKMMWNPGIHQHAGLDHIELIRPQSPRLAEQHRDAILLYKITAQS